MSEMSSFYGGRQGASFVIVKRFDGIDIPQPGDGSGVKDYTYTRRIYAVNEEGKYIITTDAKIGNVPVGNENYLIQKTKENYAKDYNWKVHEDDGSTINDTQFKFPKKLAEGMVQCFEKGVQSSSEVNYGEYVLIDTMLNMGTSNDPDNGKVFRRGMNIDSVLAGAEYIGQIIGPQGNCPELNLTTYEELNRRDEKGNYIYTHRNDAYNLTDGGLVPGSELKNGVRSYQDEIKYAWSTLKDEFGNVVGCLIGFTFPYLVEDFEARSISPYENRVEDTDGKFYHTNLISPDETEYDKNTGKWKHPFYNKWKIKVPEGIHGTDSVDLEICSTETMPAGFKENYPGAKVYTDPECKIPYMTPDGREVILTKATKLLMDNDYDASEKVISAKVNYGDGVCYVKKADCYMDIIRYKEIDYDNIESGEVTYHTIGYYNTIDRVALSERGYITVFYRAESQPEQIKRAIRWLDNNGKDAIEIAPDGTVKVWYNTYDSEGHKEFQTFPNVLDWITEVTLSQEGRFKVVFNNNTIQNGEYNTTVNWIDKVDFAEDGTIKFYFNSNHSYPAFTFSKVVKFIDNVAIETIKPGNKYKGTGDQKIHITYNTTDEDGNKITEAIGEPLNYILETCICKPYPGFDNVPYSHLLVYYSDPKERAAHKDKWVRYPSTQIIDHYDEDEKGELTIPVYHVWDEWVDLGDARGHAGGIHILKNVANMEELKDKQGNFVPPEKLYIGGEIAAYAAGWCVTLDTGNPDNKEILAYNYATKKWYPIGGINASSVDPKYVVAKAPTTESNMPVEGTADSLKANGIWFAAEKAYYAF